MSISLANNTALMIVDVQQGFDEPYWGKRNNLQGEQNIARLIARWRQDERPLFHIQHASTSPHSPLRPERPGFAFKPEAAPLPGEPVFQKSVNSAFIGTELEQTLRDRGITTLVIAGLTTDHCVSTTVRMAGNLGFQVLLPEDATATFDRVGPDGRIIAAEDMHAIHLASLHDEFCQVVTTDAVLTARFTGGE